MSKKLVLGAALFVAGAVPAFAQDSCQEPPMPVALDGATATADQVRAGMKAVNDYQSDAEKYKACLADYVSTAKAQAEKDKKPMDPAIIQAEGGKLTAMDANKQKAVNTINATITAFKAAHPPKPNG